MLRIFNVNNTIIVCIYLNLVASLLSCLYQLRSENVRLEDHVNNLIARRDHLLAVNARLAIPLNQTAVGPPTQGPGTDLHPFIVSRKNLSISYGQFNKKCLNFFSLLPVFTAPTFNHLNGPTEAPTRRPVENQNGIDFRHSPHQNHSRYL